MQKFIVILMMFIFVLTGCSAQQTVSVPSFTGAPVITTETSSQAPAPTPSEMPSPSPEPSATPAPEPKPLAGYVIGIDPGHQDHENSSLEQMSPYYAKDKIKVSLGAKGIESGVREYIFNLEISFLLKESLEAQGAQVIMTRETHDVDISNKERAQMVKEAGCDIWIRVHANYSGDREKTGICMLTPKYRSVSTEIYEKSKLLSGLIQKRAIESTGAFDHGLSYRGDITGFNWSKIPVTLIECGYLSNAEEDLLLQTEEYKLTIVEGIVRGMIDYFTGGPMPDEYDDAS